VIVWNIYVMVEILDFLHHLLKNYSTSSLEMFLRKTWRCNQWGNWGVVFRLIFIKKFNFRTLSKICIDRYLVQFYTSTAMNEIPHKDSKDGIKKDDHSLKNEKSSKEVPEPSEYVGEKRKKTHFFDALFWKGVVSGALFYIVSLVAGVLLIAWFSQDLPPLKRIENYSPPVASTVLDRYDRPIYQFYIQRREYVRYPKIPRELVEAFIVMEDRNFWNHWGVDLTSIGRALITNILKGRIVQGASTISQQLARNMFLNFRKTLSRKIKEAILAVRIEQSFSKEEIIEKYLNQIYFGHGVYGVQAAAKFYFDKNVWDLNLSEISLLAAIPRSPLTYSPYRNPELAEKRRRLILRVMLQEGVIDSAQYEYAITHPPKLANIQEKLQRYSDTAPYFMEMVRQYVAQQWGDDFLYTSGAKIYTTLDPELQKYAQETVDSMLDYFEVRYRLHPTRAEYQDTLKLYDSLGIEPPPPKYLQAGLVAIDPRTGAILALVGGRDFKESKFNHVTQAHRQPGSAFKTFVYTAAIDRGYTPASIIYDEPIEIFEPGMKETWRPQNYDGKYLGPITLRKALALSRNLASVRLAMDIGVDVIIDYAYRLGITTELPKVYSIALGSASLTPLEMTRAYATIANYGVRTKPYFIRKIVDANGDVLESREPIRETVLDSLTSFIMISILRSVVDEGTAHNARSVYGLRIPAAGKTGTTNNYRDAWFIGFSPELVAGVWVGYDSLREIRHGATGSMFAVPIWATFMKKATGNQSVDFHVPHGLTWREICTQSGMLATPYCPQTRIEVFKLGTEPTEPCTLHMKINREAEELHQQIEQEYMNELNGIAPPPDTANDSLKKEEDRFYRLP